MGNLIDGLRKYFETNSREQILSDWDKTKMFDEIGPKMDDFLIHSEIQYRFNLKEPRFKNDFHFNSYDPKFTSGFLLI